MSADDKAVDANSRASVGDANKTLLDPAVRRDRARASAFLANDFVEFGASGRIWNREQILDLLRYRGLHPARNRRLPLPSRRRRSCARLLSDRAHRCVFGPERGRLYAVHCGQRSRGNG